MIPVVMLSPDLAEYGILIESLTFEILQEHSRYNINDATEYKFKKSKCNLTESFMLDGTTLKYLQHMSPTVLYALTNAHFLSKYKRETVNFDYSKDSESEVTSYWFGKFFREFDEEYLKKSVLVVHYGYNISFCINEDSIIFIQHRVSLNNRQILKYNKNVIDYSTYTTFIRSLNKMAKMIKIEQIPENAWNVQNQISYNLLKEHYTNLEDVYAEIMLRNFHI